MIGKLAFAVFAMLCGLPASAQTIAAVNFDKFEDVASRSAAQCWECSLIEGLYSYTFSFVYRMYGHIADAVRPLLIIFMCLWFVWYVWENAIVKPQGEIGKLFGDVIKKLFLFVFVLVMLSDKMPPKEVFRWTIDPVMNAGTGLAKWILIETRNNAAVLENSKVGRYDCSKIELSANTEAALAGHRADSVTRDGLEDEEETLKNLMCVTMEFSNTYTIGAQFGFAIVRQGALGFATGYGVEAGYNSGIVQAALLMAVGKWKILIDILLGVVIFMGRFLNLLTIAIGGCVVVAFIYVAFTYLTAIIDIVVKLAMVGVMMPVVIGSMLFENVKKELFDKLLFNIIRCAFRIAFLSVAVSISTFLLEELMTMPFSTSNGASMTITRLVKSFGFDLVVDRGSMMERLGVSRDIGALSMRYESSGDPGAVLERDTNNSGSYGAWQINSGVGRMREFMDTVLLAQAPELRERLIRAGGEQGAIAATRQFVDEWQAIAREQPDFFRSLQRDYIYESHFRPAMRGITESLPASSALMSNPVLQDVVWSMSVQHGVGSVSNQSGAIGIVDAALKGRDAASLSAENAIDLIYDARNDYVQTSTISAAWKAHEAERYRTERRDALKMLK
jgi:hypothetical protein